MKKFLLISLSFVGFCFLLTLGAKSWLNYLGENQQKFNFHIGSLSVNPFKAQLSLEDVIVFHRHSSKEFLTTPKLKFRMTMGREAFVEMDKLAVHFVRDLKESKVSHEEISEKKGIFWDKLFIRINEIELISAEQKDLITFQKTNMILQAVGPGRVNEKTEFNVDTRIEGGGALSLKGRARLAHEETPFTIRGIFQDINAKVLEKLGGDSLPFSIEEGHFSANIFATSSKGQIRGEITPEIKNLKLSADKNSGLLEKTFTTAANFLFEKTKETPSITLPFVLDHDFNLTLDPP